MVKMVRATKRSDVIANASTTITCIPAAAYIVVTMPIVYDIARVKAKRSTRFSGYRFL